MKKIGRNELCNCGSGKKFKRCCQYVKTINASPFKTEKISDVGTAYSPMARLGLGLFELIDFSDLPNDKGDFLKKNGIEIAKLLHEAEKISYPIIEEIENALAAFSNDGVTVDSDGILHVPIKCTNLNGAVDFIKYCEKIINLFYLCFNKIWKTNLSREDLIELKTFLESKFEHEHILIKLIGDDMSWLRGLNDLITIAIDSSDNKVQDFKVQILPDERFFITMPSFSNGLQISKYLQVLPYNLATFIEEFFVFSINEFLDQRLQINELDESNMNKSAPVRFKVGVRVGVNLEEFKGHPKFDRIYKTGHHFYHLKEQVREAKYGKVRPIINTEYQGKKVMTVGSFLHVGDWKTFTDFLLYYIKTIFGKEWWLNEVSKKRELRSPVLDLAYKLTEYQKNHSKKEGDLFVVKPNGPMHAYLSLAYDLYILADHHKLQNSLIHRMQQPDKTNFWGARYEAMVAAIFIKAGFEIEYQPETDIKQPEFIATHSETKERIAVEAKKKNRQNLSKDENEIKLNIRTRINDAVKKYKEIPYVLFVELDLPSIEGNPMQKPWFQELLDSPAEAGVRDVDGKDFINLIVYTNYPTEHPEDSAKYPNHNHIISLSQVPKVHLKNELHWNQIVSVIDKNKNIPTLFEE